MDEISLLWNNLEINSKKYKCVFEEMRSIRDAKNQTLEEKNAFQTYGIKLDDGTDDGVSVGSAVVRNDNVGGVIDENFIVIGLGSNPRSPSEKKNSDSNSDSSKKEEEKKEENSKLERTRLYTLLSAKRLETNGDKPFYKFAKYLLQFDISTKSSNNNADFDSHDSDEMISNLDLSYETFRYFLEKVENSSFDYLVTLGYGSLGKNLLRREIGNNRKNGERYYKLLNDKKIRKHLREAGPLDYPLHISSANYKNVRAVQDEQLKRYFLG